LNLRMSGVRSVVSRDGTRLHFEVRGEGEPVVLLHGLACHREMWDEVALLLESEGRQVVTVDLRGHGDSTLVRGAFDLRQLSEDTRAVLEATGARKCTLVGHSAGGIQAIAFASSVSEHDAYRPRSVITFGTSLTLNLLPERLVLRFSATGLFYVLLRLPLVGRAVVRAGAFGKHPAPNAVTATLAWARACPREVKRGWVEAMVGQSFVSDVEAIAGRVCVGSGERDTAFSLRRLRASLRRSDVRVFEVPGAGHMAPLEQPTRVAEIILGRP
jgi:pimeloyl-ACP methyl ester carboxylesterase